MKHIAGRLFGLLALLIAGSPAAQTVYPEKSMRTIVGLPSGSQVDTVARLFGNQSATRLPSSPKSSSLKFQSGRR